MFGPQNEYIPVETKRDREIRELLDLQRDVRRLEQERRFLPKEVVQARLKKALLRLHELKGVTTSFLLRHGIEPDTPRQ